MNQGTIQVVFTLLLSFSPITSLKTNSVKFIQQSKITQSHGWIDFNEFSLGITSFTSGENTYTEVRYTSIHDWHLRGIFIDKLAAFKFNVLEQNVLVVNVQGKIMIEIDLGQNCMQALPKIISKLKALSITKYSETKNIIILANFKKSEKNVNNCSRDDLVKSSIKTTTMRSFSKLHSMALNKNMNSDLVDALIRIIESKRLDSYYKLHSKKRNKKLSLILRKKVSKRIINHILYLKSAIEGLKPTNLSGALILTKNQLSKCLEEKASDE